MTPRREAESVGSSGLGLLLALAGLHILNQLDRHMVAGFGPEIMRDLNLSRGEFGLIAGFAFSGVYAVTALFAGLLADKVGRVKVLSLGLAVWSLFTAAGGLAQGFWTMLATRPLVAAGEATLVPTATTIILNRAPQALRATAIGIFYAGVPLGIGASFLVAGQLGPLIGWRACFWIMGAIGLICVLFVVRIRDTAPSAHQESAGTARKKIAELWQIFLTNARYRRASLAIVLLHAHSATSPFVQLWLVEDKGLAKAEAASLYGSLFLVMGLAGALGSGALADWAHRRHGTDRATAMFWLLLMLAPLIIAYRLSDAQSAIFVIGMAASIIFITALYGPFFSIMEQELPDHLKATSTGMCMLILNVFVVGGLALFIGTVSDALAARHIAQSWTLPIMAADIIAFGAIALLWPRKTQKELSC